MNLCYLTVLSKLFTTSDCGTMSSIEITARFRYPIIRNSYFDQNEPDKIITDEDCLAIDQEAAEDMGIADFIGVANPETIEVTWKIIPH